MRVGVDDVAVPSVVWQEHTRNAENIVDRKEDALSQVLRPSIWTS